MKLLFEKGNFGDKRGTKVFNNTFNFAHLMQQGQDNNSFRQGVVNDKVFSRGIHEERTRSFSSQFAKFRILCNQLKNPVNGFKIFISNPLTPFFNGVAINIL